MGLWQRYVEWSRKRALLQKPTKWRRFWITTSCYVGVNFLALIGEYVVSYRYIQRLEISQAQKSQLCAGIFWERDFVFWACLFCASLMSIPLGWLSCRTWDDKELCNSDEFPKRLKRIALLATTGLLFIALAVVSRQYLSTVYVICHHA